ncbi:hypothetical protein D9611_012373 [Ephemerocybe angulata]|uniref:Uncharacterized protein n=1 Tax=Ephemerocybe angulata TaxID=980116 RepID=A0A8H5CDZ3_9AGAR|nr:hypothetical protein D9611_012373 [Tulosesus angulatus]
MELSQEPTASSPTSPQFQDPAPHEQPNAITLFAQILRLGVGVCVHVARADHTCAVAYAEDVALVAERRQERV